MKPIGSLTEYGKRLFKVPEAAEYLGCSPSQVRNYVAQGKLPNVSLDSHVRVDKADLDRMIEESKRVAV
jgi:excisionase family DNA binding protein